ncbi:MAG: carboxymuconolactone decarboxylase family protein [Pollutimonas bauzanensis]|uniref:Alkylhydroperoxidase AhpD family core domain-containing protein n=1 Tax=Pollutimonas bauzanensis TaxID=658167 RepID=A0A1M5M0K6_9BURK|nr:carboxymuconolactone decarboxylase family protein [Pollutimonas bauzanensis]SHG70837.1 alkylhydroperoxidase AhpD family core domain-containing protein [Pollutimonas bauzanensis]
MTSRHYQSLTRDITDKLGSLRSGLPQVMQSFGALGKAAMAGGALEPKTKELIALGIAVAARCDGCIGFHSQALVRMGATPDELREVLGVAVYMGGGPSLMYAANAIAAYEEFSAAHAAGQAA